MKRPLIFSLALTGLVLSGVAVWLVGRSSFFGKPTQPAFQVTPSGQGFLVQHGDNRVPLRTLRWVDVASGCPQLVQMTTQSGRQMLVMLEGTVVGGPITIPKPSTMPDNVFAFARLVTAFRLQGETWLLHYASEQGQAAPGHLLVVDLKAQRLLADQAVDGSQSALFPASRGAHVLLVWGHRPGVTQQEIRYQNPGTWQIRTSALDAPEGSGPLLAATLLPGGQVVTTDGASLFCREGRAPAWSSPLAAPAPVLTFPTTQAALVQARGALWWQPRPGQLLRLSSQGADPQPAALPPPEAPFEMDGAMLSLIGADAQGALWFRLQAPNPEVPPTHPVPALASVPPAPTPTADPSSPEAWLPDTPAQATPPATTETWKAYLAQGTERIYRWVPGASTLTRLRPEDATRALGTPPFPVGFDLGEGLSPSSGIWRSQDPARGGWVLLSALVGTHPM